MAYGKAIIVVALDVSVGNAVAVALSGEPKDAHIFDRAETLMLDDERPTTARVVCSHATVEAAAQVDVFAAGGYPPAFANAGMTHEQIDAIRGSLFCRSCDLGGLPVVYPAFIRSLGYRV